MNDKERTNKPGFKYPIGTKVIASGNMLNHSGRPDELFDLGNIGIVYEHIILRDGTSYYGVKTILYGFDHKLFGYREEQLSACSDTTFVPKYRF